MTPTLRCCLCILVFTVTVFAQNSSRPEFEVASVRVADPTNLQTSYMPTLDVRPGGTLRISNRRLDEIIMMAYDIGGQQLSGPRWLTELTTDPSTVTRFEIIAKVPDNATKEQIPLMLQKLLEDRFKLKVHRETRPTQIYALEVAPNGHKLTESTGASGRPPGCARAIDTGAGADYSAAAECSNVTMTEFARQLASLSPAYFREGVVVDKTGLKGTYDLRLEWRLLAEIEAGATGATMYQAVQKHGLRLEKKRDNAEMVIVDNIERLPTEN